MIGIHENGNKSFEAPWQHGARHGTVKLWSMDGTLQSEYSWSFGVATKSAEFYSDGTLRMESVNLSGKGHRTDKQWYADGTLKREIHYVDGEKDGEANYFYPDGSDSLRSTYQQGYLTGPVNAWHQNGTRMSKLNYIAGEMDGRAIRWSSSGALVFEANYERGEARGMARWYYETGQDSAAAMSGYGLLYARNGTVLGEIGKINGLVSMLTANEYHEPNPDPYKSYSIRDLEGPDKQWEAYGTENDGFQSYRFRPCYKKNKSQCSPDRNKPPDLQFWADGRYRWQWYVHFRDEAGKHQERTSGRSGTWRIAPVDDSWVLKLSSHGEVPLGDHFFMTGPRPTAKRRFSLIVNGKEYNYSADGLRDKEARDKKREEEARRLKQRLKQIETRISTGAALRAVKDNPMLYWEAALTACKSSCESSWPSRGGAVGMRWTSGPIAPPLNCVMSGGFKTHSCSSNSNYQLRDQTGGWHDGSCNCTYDNFRSKVSKVTVR